MKTLVGMTVPKMFSSQTRFIASMSRSAMVWSGCTLAGPMLPPAALSRMSMVPYFCRMTSRFPSSVFSSRTLVGRKRASPPAALISSTSAWPFSAVRSRSSRTTGQPWAAKYLTMVAPSTPQAPVITTTFPLMSNRLSMYCVINYFMPFNKVKTIFGDKK